jgi:hypothetical protein
MWEHYRNAIYQNFIPPSPPQGKMMRPLSKEKTKKTQMALGEE